MKKKMSALVMLFAGCMMADVLPESMRVYPTPQEVALLEGTFDTPKAVKLSTTEGFDSDALRTLAEAFTIDEEADFMVSWSVDADCHPEGYALALADGGVTIQASTGTGFFYAVKTLVQLLASDEYQPVVVQDYPTVPFRGTVEGFYGQPWSFEARKSQFRFYGDVKMNAYIYGPKDDPFHGFSNRWREPYPEVEAQRIAELVKVAKENKVNFIWAIHPGVHISWKDDSDIKACVAKFEMMYALGVRSFAVFFDDIGGEGARAEKQVELMNYVNRNFVRVKKDVTPLILCPTQYNQAWAKGYYLTILGEGLDEDIMVMWTGSSVCADITKKSMEWINNRIGRKAYIWWNWPVSDYVRPNLLLGKAYGLDKDNGELYSGFVSNPMDKPEASKIGLFGVADYLWNPKAYDADQAWMDGIRRIFPKTAEAVQTFANHNSDQGPNGHGYRREESVVVEPLVKRVSEVLAAGQMPSEEDIDALTEEFARIQQAGTTLLTEGENELFTEEVGDWLDLFARFGAMGVTLNQALKGEITTKQALCNYVDFHAQHEAISQRHAAKPFQTKIAVATRIMEPYTRLVGFVLYDRIWHEVTGTHAPKANSEVYHFITNVEELKHYTVSRDGIYVKLPRILEPKTLEPGEWIGISLPNGVVATWVHFLLTSKESLEQGRVQVSRDGGQTWGERSTIMRASGREGEVEIRNIDPQDGINAVRYINVSNKPVTLTLQLFKVDVPAGATANVVKSMTDGDLFSAYTLPAGTTIKLEFNKPIDEKNTVIIETGSLKATYEGSTLILTAEDKPVAIHEIVH